MAVEYAGYADTLTYDRLTSLSAASAALCVSGLNLLSKRYMWRYNGEKVTDEQWDEIEKLVGEAITEVLSNIVGFMFPALLADYGGLPVLPCDGSAYTRSEYPLLYARTHSSLIIDADNFRVPDMRGVFPIGVSATKPINSTGGEEEHTLTEQEMPSHVHSFGSPTFNVDVESVGVPDPTGVGLPQLPQNTSSTGGGQPHNNMPPYRAVDWLIVAG